MSSTHPSPRPAPKVDEPHEPASEKTVSAKEVGRIARAAFVGTAP